MRGRALVLGVAVFGCTIAGIRTSNAQEATPHAAVARPGRIAPTVTALPAGALEADSDVLATTKTSLILAGTLSVGAMYAASLAVAASSDNPADRYLAVPIAGPWIDLASRDDCRVDSTSKTAPESGSASASSTKKPTNCNASDAVRDDSASRALLAANGVTQGLGLLSIVSGILLPSPEGKAVSIRPRPGLTSMTLEATARF